MKGKRNIKQKKECKMELCIGRSCALEARRNTTEEEKCMNGKRRTLSKKDSRRYKSRDGRIIYAWAYNGEYIST